MNIIEKYLSEESINVTISKVMKNYGGRSATGQSQSYKGISLPAAQGESGKESNKINDLLDKLDISKETRNKLKIK